MKSKSFFNKKTIIGAVHFMPSPGFDGYQGMIRTLQKASEDVEAFVKGGVDALIFENNYDYPHTILVTDEVKKSMIELIVKISPQIPFGVSVLWNDYRSALKIAKETGGRFIRVPVFVDKVRTQYGVVEPSYKDVVAYREEIDAEDILLLTDIHVKHAELLSTMSLQESAKRAIEAGSDGLIITGKWTGDAPVLDDLRTIKKLIGNFPVIIGSGATTENISELLKYAYAAIVSTALKTGQETEGEVNLKSFEERIDVEKVKHFMKRVHK